MSSLDPLDHLRPGFADRYDVERVIGRGGTEPLWSRSGDELFYRDAANSMVAVGVRTTPTFTLGASKVLFPASNYASFAGHHQYSVSADGRRFLMVRQYGVAQTPRLVLVKNWVGQLKTRNASR